MRGEEAPRGIGEGQMKEEATGTIKTPENVEEPEMEEDQGLATAATTAADPERKTSEATAKEDREIARTTPTKMSVIIGRGSRGESSTANIIRRSTPAVGVDLRIRRNTKRRNHTSSTVRIGGSGV